ncbi:MAG: CHRD domain-containing protein, partial [Bacteroidota bacterium]
MSLKPKVFRSLLLLLALSLPSLALSAQCDGVSGGELLADNGTRYVPVCLDDEEGLTEVIRSGFSGANSQYFLTNAAGFIIRQLDGAPPFDLTDLRSGVFAIWSVAYSGSLTGVAIGDNICASGATGCFSISNALVVNRKRGDDCDDFCPVSAGMLTVAGTDMTEIYVCQFDGNGVPVGVDLTGELEGDNMTFIITNDNNEILAIPEGSGPFDLDVAGEGVCLIWHLSFLDGLEGLEVGNTPDDFVGCFNLSNPVTAERQAVDGGRLFLVGNEEVNEITICAGDGESDAFETMLMGAQGDSMSYVITDADNIILMLADGPPFDLEGAGPGTCRIYHVSWNRELTGLAVGNNINDLVGCWDRSGAITVNRNGGLEAGSLTLAGDTATETFLCLVDDFGLPVGVDLTGDVSGDSTTFLITNANNEILAIPDNAGPFDLSVAGNGTCLIWHLAYKEGFAGLAIGNTPEDFVGCFALSNPVTVVRQVVDGGRLFLAGDEEINEITICAGDGESDAFETMLMGAEGDSMSYVITNADNEILMLAAGPPFDLEGAGAGLCRIYHVSWNGALEGLVVGENIDNLVGCWDRSGAISVNRVAAEICTASGEFTANLSGVVEVPCPVTTTGTGTITATLANGQLTVSGSFSGLTSDFDADIAGGAHLHLGMAGMGGPVALLLNSDLDDDLRGGSFAADSNVFDLNAEQLAALLNRGMYVNIHTEDFGPGELRGQLVPADADAYKMAYLLGVNEVPSVVTSAIGGIVLERTGNTITVSGSVNGLTAPVATQLVGGAHIHQATAGRNGPIVFPLNLELSADSLSAVFLPDSNVFELSEEQLAALDMDMLYVNVHSAFSLPGELRGQLTDMAVASFYANAAGHQARPVAINTPGNGRIMINYDGAGSISVTGSVDDLQDTIATSIAGGAHLHLGLPGQTGGVEFVLNVELDDDRQGGVFLADSNTFTITEDQLQTLLDRGYYLNVHSGAFPSGEVR